MNGSHDNLFLSIGSCIGSVLSFIVAAITAYNIAWLVGVIAGVVSIYAGILTIKEKKKSMKHIDEMDIYFKNKSGGHL